MDYERLFEEVRRHLDRLGIGCEVSAGKVATEQAVRQVEEEIKIRLPAELRKFYQTVGDGLEFRWRDNLEEPKWAFANLQIPNLEYLASMYIGWREIALYTPEQAEKYGFPHTKDPALAKQTATRMWHWLPVIELGNGDLICLDLADPGGPVIFNKHDWMDGGTGENGHRLAANWREFLASWGSVCFQFPESLYWPSCFREGGGVAWEGEQFRSPYRIVGLAE